MSREKRGQKRRKCTEVKRATRGRKAGTDAAREKARLAVSPGKTQWSVEAGAAGSRMLQKVQCVVQCVSLPPVRRGELYSMHRHWFKSFPVPDACKPILCMQQTACEMQYVWLC